MSTQVLDAFTLFLTIHTVEFDVCCNDLQHLST